MAAPASIHASGKRKTAIARVYLRPGSGRILVNQRNFEEYFPMETTRNLVQQPLQLVNMGAEFDILVNVR
ncbi:MAG: 30S ribosomal protein S9, partial [Desulfobaccales bacterium]